MQPILIPRHIDDPKQILFWEIDEFFSILVGLIVGIVAGYTISGLVIGVMLAAILKKLKHGELPGSMQHFMYSTGAIPLNDEYDDGLKKDYVA